ncbi:hypothetical protein MMC18_006798 [Xylographa bjoerkii]|nr:hypothetical protein [Xylographa bjoerkii]
MSTLQMGEYVTNWKQFAGLGPRKLPDGSYLLVKPCPGDVPIPMVYTANDTGSFVKALVQSPPGTNLLGYGSLIGWSEYMRLWTSVLKVSGRFEQIPIETYMDKAPVNLAKEIQEAYAYQAEFGWDGGDPSIVHPKDLLVDVPTTSVEEYIRGEDWSSVLEAQST